MRAQPLAAWLALDLALAVLLGAFAAHLLRARLSVPALATWDTAQRYQTWQALGLLACLRFTACDRRVRSLILGGSVVFSASLYAVALGAAKPVAWITPLGGMAMVGGWLLLAWQLRQEA